MSWGLNETYVFLEYKCRVTQTQGKFSLSRVIHNILFLVFIGSTDSIGLRYGKH